MRIFEQGFQRILEYKLLMLFKSCCITGERLHNIGLMNLTLKAQQQKQKQTNHQTKRLLYNKGNNQKSEKGTIRMGENSLQSIHLV